MTYKVWKSCRCSFTKLCLTLCNPMDCSTPGFPLLHCFLEFAQLMYIESVMPSNHCTLCHLLSCLQSFLASESFPMSGLFISDLASASVLPVNIQCWIPLGFTGLISLQSYMSFPAPPFESINSSMLSLLYGPTFTPMHDYWKNHSFDYKGPRISTGISL